MTTPLRTADEVRAEFERKGISIREWCLANGFSYQGFIHLLCGRNKGLKGSGHQAAIAVGLKHGEVSGVVSIDELADRKRAAYSAAINPLNIDGPRHEAPGISDGPLSGNPLIEAVVRALRSGSKLIPYRGESASPEYRALCKPPLRLTHIEMGLVDLAIDALQRAATRKP